MVSRRTLGSSRRTAASVLAVDQSGHCSGATVADSVYHRPQDRRMYPKIIVVIYCEDERLAAIFTVSHFK